MVLCRFEFRTLNPNRLMQIDKISCGGPVLKTNPIQFFILTTSANFEALNPVGVIPAKQTIDLGDAALIVANENGPYFYGPGETVYIFSGGLVGNTPQCVISGRIATIK